MAPVGSFKPNPWKLYDMLGNVWEWCLDAYKPYHKKSVTDPYVKKGKERVDRGGGWDSLPMNGRASTRGAATPGFSCVNLGFRLVKEID